MVEKAISTKLLKINEEWVVTRKVVAALFVDWQLLPVAC
jgi:hypothetical protein